MIEELLEIERALSRELAPLRFGAPVTHVYDPLDYAWAPHAAFVRRWLPGPGRTLLVGMNPGPYGMAQTGVPFGAIGPVRDWLGVSGEVRRPAHESPHRPVTGFATVREEVSGTRLWGWARRRFGTPEALFDRLWIVPWCPLMFLEASGRNRTPDQLTGPEKKALYAACDAALTRTIDLLRPVRAVGIGRLAEDRLRRLRPATPIPVFGAPHPSPASPLANRGWEPLFEDALREAGVELPDADL